MAQNTLPEGRCLIAVAQFNRLVTQHLEHAAKAALLEQGIADGLIEVVGVAGVWELPPLIAAAAATGRYRLTVAVGAVIRGETDHYSYVARTALDALSRIQAETHVPVGLGVLTTDTLDQALNRAGGKAGNKGSEAALAALALSNALKKIGA